MGVELRSDEHADGGDIEPNQRSHHCPQGAVHHGVVGETREIEAETQVAINQMMAAPEAPGSTYFQACRRGVPYW